MGREMKVRGRRRERGGGMRWGGGGRRRGIGTVTSEKRKRSWGRRKRGGCVREGGISMIGLYLVFLGSLL